MGRTKEDISDYERYEKHLAKMRIYRNKRYTEDPEYKEKVKAASSLHQKKMIENAKKIKAEMQQENENKSI